ncbi:MAG: sulfite exporter TauE/SafE family protein [Clostridiales bacterium]|jgi:sulfite exporter TauE/SafE/copper chaperone CopZ|nr:sulfite exporter TauE/SafE family protein [Clostridiales bacterium]
MDGAIKKKRLYIDGMTCVSCQERIEKRLRNTRGIISANVSYNSGVAYVAYDRGVISLGEISNIIECLDYRVIRGRAKKNRSDRTIGLLVIIVALFMIMQHFGILNLLAPSRLADTQMGYGMLFVMGLITSVHCVAMCGGINLSQCIQQGGARSNSRNDALRPSFLYNLGRVVSYTAVGFVVGALGSVITFSNVFQGVLKLMAGVFMVIMGVNMMGMFPSLRKFTPRMPKRFARKINEEKDKQNSPLIIGLLNGLMPCGPLQAMQIYALSTGNAFAGAFSMFVFSIGTVPLMFGLGAFSTILSGRFKKKVMAVGAILVVVMGLSMLSQGWSLSGIRLSRAVPNSGAAQTNALSEDKVSEEQSKDQQSQSEDQIHVVDGVQLVNSTLTSGKYPTITVQSGTPVKWVIDAPKGSVNGCNGRMYISEYDIEYSFTEGENVIEFTPTEAKTVKYICWMGMISGTINVVPPKSENPV